MFRSRLSALLVAAIAAVPLLSACAQASSAPAPGPGAGITLNFGQLGTAKTAEALLEAAGETPQDYRVSYSLFANGGPGFLEAVPSGAVDVAIMADTPSIFAQANGVPVKAVAVARSVPEQESTVGILVRADSPVRTVADLKGRKVAVTEGTILQYTLVRALQAAGLSYADIQVVNLAPTDAAAALQSGSVDAATALDPQRSQLELGGARLVGDGKGITSGHSFVVATDKALADPVKSGAILDYTQRYSRANAWAQDHPQEWSTAFAKVTGLKPEVATNVIQRQAFDLVPIDDSVIAAQQEQADVYFERGLLKSKLDVRAQFDDRFNSQLIGGTR